MEQWKHVNLEGYEDYEVSDEGNVRRKGKIIKPTLERNVYSVRLWDGHGNRKKISLPRLVLMTFKPEECPQPIENYNVSFKDGVIDNIVLDNLMWSRRCVNAKMSKGKPRPKSTKYKNIVIYYKGEVIVCFDSVFTGDKWFAEHGMPLGKSTLRRVAAEEGNLFGCFSIKRVPDDVYEVTKLNTKPDCDVVALLSEYKYLLKVERDRVKEERIKEKERIKSEKEEQRKHREAERLKKLDEKKKKIKVVYHQPNPYKVTSKPKPKPRHTQDLPKLEESLEEFLEEEKQKQEENRRKFKEFMLKNLK